MIPGLVDGQRLSSVKPPAALVSEMSEPIDTEHDEHPFYRISNDFYMIYVGVQLLSSIFPHSFHHFQVVFQSIIDILTFKDFVLSLT